jgi:hypothetical protein
MEPFAAAELSRDGISCLTPLPALVAASPSRLLQIPELRGSILVLVETISLNYNKRGGGKERDRYHPETK